MLTVFVIGLAILSLRLRVRFVIGPGKKSLFAGLGRTGVELDFATGSGRIKFAGIGIKQLSLTQDDSEPEKETKDKERTKTRPPKEKKQRQRDWKQGLRLLPKLSSAIFGYLVSILKSLIVEELRADIRGGFDSPDMTGKAFGYYQAALAAAPHTVGRVHYTPDWTGASFDGTARGSIALPIYKLLYHTISTLRVLPLRELMKLAIGKKRGGQDG
ncbi:MAG: hypothetical protein P1R58_10325 [bacterium]|nr:hypothetical protein [bacterium]